MSNKQYFPQPIRKQYKLVLYPHAQQRPRRYESLSRKQGPTNHTSSLSVARYKQRQSEAGSMLIKQGTNKEKSTLDENVFNSSNGATSSTNNSGARSHSPIDKSKNTNKDFAKSDIKLPLLHNTCCNFFKPTTIQKNTLSNLLKGTYLSKISETKDANTRKIYTSKGNKRQAAKKEQPYIKETKTLTSINFFKPEKVARQNDMMASNLTRPESRHNPQTICATLEGCERRPLTSIKNDIVIAKKKIKEDSMFSIDEELLSDD